MSRRLPTSPLAGILVLVLLASSLLAFFSTPAAAYGERVYESNTDINGNTNFDVYSAQSVAQSFLASGTYRLVNTTLRLRNTGDTSDAIDISIRTDAGNTPSDAVLAATQFVIGNNVLANYAVAFPSPPNLSVGERYWIVASCPSSTPNAYEWHHSDADSYANGNAMRSLGSVWVNPSSATDMYFVTYGREVEANLTVGFRAVRLETPSPSAST